MDTARNAICHWLPFQCGNQSDGFQLSYSVYAVRTVIWSMYKRKRKSDGLKASAAGFFKILFLKLLFSTCSKKSVEFWGRYYCGSLQHWFGINNVVMQCMNESQSWMLFIMDFIFWRQNNEYMYFFTVYEDQFLQFNNVNNLRREMCSV